MALESQRTKPRQGLVYEVQKDGSGITFCLRPAPPAVGQGKEFRFDREDVPWLKDHLVEWMKTYASKDVEAAE